ncbi:MAG: GGDEF domain-containing protein [Coriobacteriia bacterium]|nr:GGDEF domain-containing protein [Coriobacteriia bacterium]
MTVRLWSRLKRSFVISKRQQLTQDDIHALRENQQRVALIINARWLVILLFMLFSLVGVLASISDAGPQGILASMVMPVNALIFVAAYNFIFSRLNVQLSNVSAASMVQFAFDVIVVTVLVYFSGGVESWFWVVYLLILVVAALFGQNMVRIWLLALFMCVMLLSVYWGSYFGVIPYQNLPFTAGVEWYSAQYVIMRSLWQISMIFGTALIASNGVTWLLNLVSDSRESQLIDLRTGLYSRAFLLRTQEIEGYRALRDGRSLHLMLIDIDNFAAINERFGIEKGDTVIKLLAQQLVDELLEFDNNNHHSTNIAARISGEEFALLISECSNKEALSDTDICGRDVALLAEKIRSRIAVTDYEGISITVSIGLANLPLDTLDPSELSDRADEALLRAVSEGGDCIAVPHVRDLEVALNVEISP